LEFESGALGSIDGLLNVKYGYDARVEVVGDQGILCIGDIQGQPILWGSSENQVAFPPFPSFADRFAPAYVQEIQHFVDCILSNSEPAVGVLDGLHAVVVAGAVNESITKGLPVTIE
jgi:predicted dehydrogenase